MENATTFHEHVLQDAAINLDIVPIHLIHADICIHPLEFLVNQCINIPYKKISPPLITINVRVNLNYVHPDAVIILGVVHNLSLSVSMYIMIITRIRTITFLNWVIRNGFLYIVLLVPLLPCFSLFLCCYVVSGEYKKPMSMKLLILLGWEINLLGTNNL